MILYRKEPYPIQMKNTIVLDDIKSGGVVYVNKATYDQALILSSRLDGDPKRVIDILKSPKTEAWRATIGLKALIEDMMSSMPKPLNMLAPFLMFCVQNQGIEWKADDREFAYGILHQYSQLMDLNAITLVPMEVRNNIVIPTNVLKDYETSWNDLCSTLKDNVLINGMQGSQPVVNVQPATAVQPMAATQPIVTQTAQPVAAPAAPQPVKQDGQPKSQADRIAEFQERMRREAEEEERQRKEKAAKRAAQREAEAAKEGKSATPAPAPAQPKSSASEAAESNSILDEFDV